MREYIITDEQAKEIVNQLPPYYVPTWLYLWAHTVYPNEPPFDWMQVREQHVGVNLPEIVRCRDCKHYGCDGYDEHYCYYWDKLREPDGFCAWGVKRKEGGE